MWWKLVLAPREPALFRLSDEVIAIVLDAYAQEGTVSWFGADPDPELYGDDPTALMTLAGVAALIMSQDPGRRI